MRILLIFLVLLSGCGTVSKDAVPPKPVVTFGNYQWDQTSKTIIIQVLPTAGQYDLPQFNGQIVEVILTRKY